jgi:galactitol PTS system EIIA component
VNLELSHAILEDFVSFLDVDDTDELFDEMYWRLYKKNVVKSSFLSAIKEREVAYPTGLATETFGIAIPHTDAIHVKKEVISIGILKNPVTFRHMGMGDIDVQVRVVFMLALQKPENQLEVLQMVTGLIQNNNFLQELIGCKSSIEVVSTIRRFSSNEELSKK